MVDIHRRKRLAIYLSQLADGIITNDDFEESIMKDVSFGWLPEQYYRAKAAKTDDPVIPHMLEHCWCLYHDTKQHKLVEENALTEKERKEVDRWILFLNSELEYEWPVNPLRKVYVRDLILILLTLGLYNYRVRSLRKARLKETAKVGDLTVWPFIRLVDYKIELRKGYISHR